jgi:hypothetical protein
MLTPAPRAAAAPVKNAVRGRWKKVGFRPVAEGFKLYFDGTEQPSDQSWSSPA